jgi:hypothetical protein
LFVTSFRVIYIHLYTRAVVALSPFSAFVYLIAFFAALNSHFSWFVYRASCAYQRDCLPSSGVFAFVEGGLPVSFLFCLFSSLEFSTTRHKSTQLGDLVLVLKAIVLVDFCRTLLLSTLFIDAESRDTGTASAGVQRTDLAALPRSSTNPDESVNDEPHARD